MAVWPFYERVKSRETLAPRLEVAKIFAVLSSPRNVGRLWGSRFLVDSFCVCAFPANGQCARATTISSAQDTDLGRDRSLLSADPQTVAGIRSPSPAFIFSPRPTWVDECLMNLNLAGEGDLETTKLLRHATKHDKNVTPHFWPRNWCS